MKKILVFLIAKFSILGCLKADDAYYSKNQVVESFIELFPNEKDALSTAVQENQIESNALTAPLRRIYPDFAKALMSAADDPSVGIDQLSKISDTEDNFLEAESLYYLSRLLISEGRYEELFPNLEKIRIKLKNKLSKRLLPVKIINGKINFFKYGLNICVPI